MHKQSKSEAQRFFDNENEIRHTREHRQNQEYAEPRYTRILVHIRNKSIYQMHQLHI